VLYSRNGLFAPAAQCFLQAGDSLNAAKCFREIGKHHEAADLFAKAAHFGEAAECLEKSGLLFEAARNWMKVQKLPHAIHCWNTIGRDPAQLNVCKPSHEELEAMFQALKADASLSGILKILAKSSEAAGYILTLLSDNSFQTAKEIFGQTPQHISGSLLGTINVQSPAAGLLVNLYQDSGQHRNAAILLEQMERFEEAADYFAKSGDSERAKYCAGRANKKSGRIVANAKPADEAAPTPSSTIPKASFFIDASALNTPATSSAAPASAPSSPLSLSMAESISPNKVLNIRPEPTSQPRSKLPLTNDETVLLNRTWLFQQINESEVELLVARFSAVEYAAGHRIQSGSPNSFLVLVIDGDFHSSQRDSSLDGWLSPESGLGDQAPIEWVVTSDKARAVVIGSADFSAILAKDSDLTRQVYINLTQKLFASLRNPLYSKAI
jgi:tetratricopeptide (TPR) repeat protein